MKTLPSPPTSAGLFGKVLGHLAELRQIAKLNNETVGKALYIKKKEWYRQAGSKTIVLNMMGRPVILCSDPAVYKEVLGAKQDSFTNSRQFKKIVGHFFPTSMIVVNGDQWQRIRKVVQRAIGKQSLTPLVAIMCEITETLLRQPKLNEMETADLMNRITFDSFHRVMYGWNPESISESTDSLMLLKACNTIASAFGKRAVLTIPWLWKLPTKENREVDKAHKFIQDYISTFVASRQKTVLDPVQDSKAVSLLDAMIIAARSGEDGGMTDQELKDQIATLFFGAYDTTSSTLLFLLNHLARDPRVQGKLRQHVLARFPNGRADLSCATVDDVESVAYLNHVVDEVNRLHGIATLLGRTCVRDVEIAGFRVAAGRTFVVDMSTVGRDPALWGGQADLDAFRPERWAEARPPPLVGQLAFGFGGRICPGRRIALAEMKAFLAAALCTHRVALRVPGEPVATDMRLGLNLKPGTGSVDFTPLAGPDAV